MQRLDVLMVSDFRLLGGTNHSNAQELAIHKEMGLRTGLVQSNSRLSAKALAWAPVITETLCPSQVEPVLSATPVHARVALLRHPIAAASMPDVSRYIRVDQAFIIANQPAVRPNGTPEYDVAAITDVVEERLGVRPTWAPIGPVVRASLESSVGDISLLPFDWENIFAQNSGMPERHGFDTRRPRIGRHSRPQPAKWPELADDILSAYPASDGYDVRILGGADPALDALGHRPVNWTIHPFGSMPPMEFLREVDFWVYFHRSDWSEAYGRAIMEALWSGAVVILPEYLRVTFGDAAVYGRPSDVQGIIHEFCVGDRDYNRQSVIGQDFARAHGREVHVSRMRTLLKKTPGSTSSVGEPEKARGLR